MKHGGLLLPEAVLSLPCSAVKRKMGLWKEPSKQNSGRAVHEFPAALSVSEVVVFLRGFNTFFAYAKEARYSPEEEEEDMGDRRNCHILRATPCQVLCQAPVQVRSRGLLKSHRVGSRICQLP